jgi:uncharacterized protein
MNRYEQTKTFILNKLKTELPVNLYYHGFHHVLDVLGAAQELARKEKIAEPETELLRVAVLFHDSGYTIDSKNHEELSCKIAKENLPQFGYNDQEIERICGMIMATKFPHHPKNLLEEIICDADLDYLGRDDFFKISNDLFKELRISGKLSNEKDWYKLQESFLSSHTYFTRTASALRKAKKEEHLNKIREVIKSN